MQESCPSQADSIGTVTLLLYPSSILASGYLLRLVKIKNETSRIHAMLGQAPGPKLNWAPQQLSGGLMQFYEPHTRLHRSSCEFKTAMPHIDLKYNERQMLTFLLCCCSLGSTLLFLKQ